MPARLGGYICAKFIIALGEVPRRCVEILNFELAQRSNAKASGRRGTYAPVPGPRLFARALAASQGQAEAPRGVQHGPGREPPCCASQHPHPYPR